jgi:hypothetical protein
LNKKVRAMQQKQQKAKGVAQGMLFHDDLFLEEDVPESRHHFKDIIDALASIPAADEGAK